MIGSDHLNEGYDVSHVLNHMFCNNEDPFVGTRIF